MALTDNFIKEQLKQLLPINSTGYDSQLDILLKGAKAKMKMEGVDDVFEENDNMAFRYIICLSYQIAKDMDFEIDFNKLNEQYITSVNLLRTYLNGRESNN